MISSGRLARVKAIHMTKLDFVDHVGLVTTFGTDREQPLIGVGRYIVCVGGAKHDRAEVAFAVIERSRLTLNELLKQARIE
jgi:hypothetical protein